MKRFLRRLHPFWRWLLRSQLVVLFIVIFLIAIASALMVKSELAMKLAASFLQGIGTITVVLNNRGTSKRIGLLPPWLRIRQWVRERPPILSPVTVSVSASIMVGAGSMTATGLAVISETATDLIELRLREIERNIQALRQELLKATGEIANQVELQRIALEAEKQELLKVKQTADAARDSLASGIDLSTIGAWWLIAGMILGMFPKELSDLVTPLPPSGVWIWNGLGR